MFVIDCISPLSQKILEQKLDKFINKSSDYKFIITDRKDLNGKNCIKVDKEIKFPFSKNRVELFIGKYQQEFKKHNVKNDILKRLEYHNKKLLEDIGDLFEK